MCKFYSAIVLRNGDILHNQFLTSHEDIIRLFQLRDDDAYIERFVRVEFSPKNTQDLPDVEKYSLRVDESTTPDWFAEIKDGVIERMKDIIRQMIVTVDTGLIVGRCVIIKGAKVESLRQSRVEYMENSTVNEMWENSTVGTMYENSSVGTMYENSSVKAMRENSSVGTMYENSSVKAMLENSSVGTMYENSSVKAMWENSSVETMRENSSVGTMWENSSVGTMYENSSVKAMRENSSVETMRENSSVKAKGKNAKAPTK